MAGKRLFLQGQGNVVRIQRKEQAKERQFLADCRLLLAQFLKYGGEPNTPTMSAYRTLLMHWKEVKVERAALDKALADYLALFPLAKQAYLRG